jgi:hypothetical protein
MSRTRNQGRPPHPMVPRSGPRMLAYCFNVPDSFDSYRYRHAISSFCAKSCLLLIHRAFGAGDPRSPHSGELRRTSLNRSAPTALMLWGLAVGGSSIG